YSVIEALNWYSYVSNNPVMYVDPAGMWEFKVGVGTGAALKFRIHTDDNGNIDADIATGVGVGFLLTFDPLSTSENIGPGMLTAELSASVDIEGAGMRAGVTLDSVVAIENSGKLEDRSSFTISVPPAPGVSVEYKYDVAAGEGTSKHSAATEWGVQGMIFMGVGEDLDEW
ncbi:hypothetical protein S1OALGB6SA_2412, partial [Olavius algarvensis spirochete endosymbiont]|uniref:hypothetical protein n=1 Tax=Olavius algarvensis spirochete endosymbiont TaxID=260710 RepID=UPI000F1C9917